MSPGKNLISSYKSISRHNPWYGNLDFCNKYTGTKSLVEGKLSELESCTIQLWTFCASTQCKVYGTSVGCQLGKPIQDRSSTLSFSFQGMNLNLTFPICIERNYFQWITMDFTIAFSFPKRALHWIPRCFLHTCMPFWSLMAPRAIVHAKRCQPQWQAFRTAPAVVTPIISVESRPVSDQESLLWSLPTEPSLDEWWSILSDLSHNFRQGRPNVVGKWWVIIYLDQYCTW